MSFTQGSDSLPAGRSQKIRYYEVALPLRLQSHLIYTSEKQWSPGTPVLVPLKTRTQQAVILKEVKPPAGDMVFKSVLSRDRDRVSLSEVRLKWLMWMARYYHHNPGLVVHLSFPPLKPLKKNKSPPAREGFVSEASETKAFQQVGEGLVPEASDKGKSPSRKGGDLSPSSRGTVLNAEQLKCVTDIRREGQGFKVHLLKGVTGSGKTEVFFELMAPVLKQNRTVLVLVPEIALTPQHVKRFSLRFGGEVACFHSHLSPRQKTNVWEEVLKGTKRILLGPRSVLFCPLPNLGLIVVDEEHEVSFKQEDKLKYHGRDGAIYLARCLNVPVILASATPSLESWHHVQTGRYDCHQLQQRFFKAPVPVVEIVDMKKENKHPDRPFWLSESLHQALSLCLKKKKQAALFLNRRGESSYVFCPGCGYSFSCLNCDISLTQHQKTHLVCHYCGYREEKPPRCPECGSGELATYGLGTQSLQQELQLLFPQARVARADRDEIKTHREWQALVQEVETGSVNILIGTQMIAKGLDFPGLSLVGMVLADPSLHIPDFRSSEKSFQLFMQMAGRCGRRQNPGRVLLQTYNPSHPVVQSLKKGDYENFALQELGHRKKYNYPPFCRLALIRTQALKKEKALQTAVRIKESLKKFGDIKLLGPAPAPVFRIKNQYRYHLLLKGDTAQTLNSPLRQVEQIPLKTLTARVHINRDPVSML